MSLSSSASESLASGLQNLVRTELKGIQSGIKKAIASRVDPDMTTAGGETDALEEGILGELTGRVDLTRRIPRKEKNKEKPDTEQKPTDLLREKGLPLPF